MSESRTTDQTPEGDESLKLADSNDGSTTEIVQDASATSRSGQSAGESVGADASTGGFESRMRKLDSGP